MRLQEFLRKVLPSSGTYYTVQITSTGSTRQFNHADIAQVEHAINAINGRHHNAYVATGGFGDKRTKAQCKLKRAFYVDIDCKEGGQYNTKKEAVQAIKAALHAGLPPYSILVDSGNGFHLYWTLIEDITKQQWMPYAKALVNACDQTGLRIDKVVTIDPARILRAPDTLNQKDPKNPKPCSIKAEGIEYDFHTFSSKFNQWLSTPAALPSTPIDNSDLSEGLAEGKKAKAAEMIELCPMFKHTLETKGAGQPEPLWHKVIHTLAYCEDGHDWIHRLSEGHEGYNYGRTERKFAQRLQYKDESGAIKCDTFAASCKECADCEWRGRINSPIKLGFGPPSDMPYGWRNGAMGLERLDDDEWERAVRYTVSDLRVAAIPGVESYVRFKVNGQELVAKLSEDFRDTTSLGVFFFKKTLALSVRELSEVRDLMTTWIEKLQKSKQVGEMVPEYGWTPKGFHHGDTMYKADGSTSYAFRVDDVMASALAPKGELAPWTECANHVLQQPREASWAVIASAFAGPLVKFTGATGAILSLVSQDSGTGKSTTMRIAQAVWGHPKSAMASLNDTPNAIAHRLGMLHNLPSYWDEVREKDEVNKLVNLLFRVSQGKDKARMTTGIQQRVAGEWDTMLVVATNDPLKDHIAQTIGNSDAGTARVFEIEAGKVKDSSMGDAKARHFYGRLSSNYGKAGEVYAEYLAQHEEDVKKLVQTFDDKISGAFSTKGDERFWVVTIATLLAGATLANRLGLCKFNLKRLQAYLINEFKSMRTLKKEQWQDPVDRAVADIARFLHEKAEYIVHAEGMPVRGKKQPSILLDSIRQPAVARIGSKDNTIRILKEDFEQWLYKRGGAGYSHVIRTILAEGAVKHRGSVDAGTVYSTKTRLWCLDIPTTGKFKNLGSFARTLPADSTDNSDLG